MSPPCLSHSKAHRTSGSGVVSLRGSEVWSDTVRYGSHRWCPFREGYCDPDRDWWPSTRTWRDGTRECRVVWCGVGPSMSDPSRKGKPPHPTSPGPTVRPMFGRGTRHRILDTVDRSRSTVNGPPASASRRSSSSTVARVRVPHGVPGESLRRDDRQGRGNGRKVRPRWKVEARSLSRPVPVLDLWTEGRGSETDTSPPSLVGGEAVTVESEGRRRAGVDERILCLLFMRAPGGPTRRGSTRGSEWDRGRGSRPARGLESRDTLFGGRSDGRNLAQ